MRVYSPHSVGGGFNGSTMGGSLRGSSGKRRAQLRESRGLMSGSRPAQPSGGPASSERTTLPGSPRGWRRRRGQEEVAV